MVKNLQKSGRYLRNKVESYHQLSMIFFAIFVHFIFIYVSLISFVIGGFFLGSSLNYRSGIYGEQRTIEILQNLPDSYSLINDVNLPSGYGNIDHVVLGHNGIFVIETKNFEGQFRCEGDQWYKYKDTWSKEYEQKSPSKQVKRNALILKQYLTSKRILNQSLIWVEAIVVLTHHNVSLDCNNPTVPILESQELCNYIQNNRARITFSSPELEKIARVLKQLRNLSITSR